MKSLLTICFQLCLAVGLLSQPASFVVQLKKNFELPKATYYYGDYIEIKIGEDWIGGAVTQADSSNLRVGKEIVSISEIDAVRIRKSLLSLFGSAFQGGGLLYLGVVSANSLINDERPVLRSGEAIGGVAAVGLGFLLKRVSYQDIELEEGWQLRVIQFSE